MLCFCVVLCQQKRGTQEHNETKDTHSGVLSSFSYKQPHKRRKQNAVSKVTHTRPLSIAPLDPAVAVAAPSRTYALERVPRAADLAPAPRHPPLPPAPAPVGGSVAPQTQHTAAACNQPPGPPPTPTRPCVRVPTIFGVHTRRSQANERGFVLRYARCRGGTRITEHKKVHARHAVTMTRRAVRGPVATNARGGRDPGRA